MGTKPIRVDETTKERIEEHAEESEGSTAEVATEVAEAGLREHEGPVAHRLRQKAMDAAFYLAMTSVVVLVIGGATQMLSPVRAVMIALSIMTVAVGALAAVECLRWLRGQSVLRDASGDDS